MSIHELHKDLVDEPKPPEALYGELRAAHELRAGQRWLSNREEPNATPEKLIRLGYDAATPYIELVETKDRFYGGQLAAYLEWAALALTHGAQSRSGWRPLGKRTRSVEETEVRFALLNGEATEPTMTAGWWHVHVDLATDGTALPSATLHTTYDDMEDHAEPVEINRETSHLLDWIAQIAIPAARKKD